MSIAAQRDVRPIAGVGPVEAAVRHPLDPEPVRSTKSSVVLALGVVALLTGPFVGGVVPATLALLLGREAHRQAYAAGGFLTGGAALRTGRRLAWAGIVLAATTLVIAVVTALVHWAQAPVGQDFDSNIN